MADDTVNSEELIAQAVIITNLSPDFFDSSTLKEEFEAAFRGIDSEASFNYLKSFRRARVNFTTLDLTLHARHKFNNTELCGQTIKCYFAQLPRQTSEDHLLPPKPEKMFLISPPCSPPVGWEQNRESEPIINFELIQALSRLTPGETHEVQPPTESLPSIVVHVCEDPEGYATRPQLIQTRRPHRE